MRNLTDEDYIKRQNIVETMEDENYKYIFDYDKMIFAKGTKEIHYIFNDECVIDKVAIVERDNAQTLTLKELGTIYKGLKDKIKEQEENDYNVYDIEDYICKINENIKVNLYEIELIKKTIKIFLDK